MTLFDRFLSYVSYPTMSDDGSDTCPSSAKQLALAARLCEDLRAIGLSDARVDMYGYVYASIEENVEGAPSIGFIAHMDTALEMPDSPIRPRTVIYEGQDIPLSEDGSVILRATDLDALGDYRGHRLVVTDGRTLLGGDDKAGIAAIVEALARIVRDRVPHGRIAVAFTPDEEIGRGTDHFDLDAFACDFAYTVDGGALGELEYENFNAARATVTVCGTPIHPGSAKGRMKNAVRIAAELDTLLPAAELPELTEGYEGFHHLTSLSGDVAAARAVYLIRDHSEDGFLRKKEDFCRAVALLNGRYGQGTVSLEITDSYYNMRRVIDAAPYTVELARTAMQGMGIVPHEPPIRGGTDGAMLSHRGLPCPNLGMGVGNMHSALEFVSVDDLERTAELLVRIAALGAGIS